MRVLGFGFEREQDASDAERELVAAFGLGPNDSKVADLADDGVLLAVRAREENVSGVKSVLRQHGGEQLVDVDERWTGLSTS